MLFDTKIDKISSYKDCPVLCELMKSSESIKVKVPLDEFTEMAQLNFDYKFDGVSEFYPFVLSDEVKNIEFKTMVICGKSGGAKVHYSKNLKIIIIVKTSMIIQKQL